ncbi:class I SAM-dependent methyltransferase [Pelagibius sp. Alg239-R121]|uniref:class I SAM-dependent methyltransferase n=1 Tax=Pelagibius sp. Alg239-R121 TaxID=2993448 RepID=UPI0024A61B08|nr:class I SAM-dependent methyltransferase [Pelagibius sp. Alg239-R121]
MTSDYKQKEMNLGYVQAVPRPTQDELDAFYREIYFGENVTATYQVEYSDDELRQKKLRADCNIELLSQHIAKTQDVSFLEIGCGEGFLVASSVEKGWQTLGVDYQLQPVEKFNPDIVRHVIATNPSAYLEEQISAGVKKDVIAIQNVLEHVIEPEKLLQNISGLLNPDGCLFVQVPNDFSALQRLARDQGKIEKDHWFLPPQHLNYFNDDNVGAFVRSYGFRIVDGVSDFPIEMYLWGNSSNYTKDQSLGKFAHEARIQLDLFVARNGMEKYVNFYRSAFQVGLGRNMCLVLKLHD